MTPRNTELQPEAPGAWVADAACAGLDVNDWVFDTHHDSRRPKPSARALAAKRVCKGCPVKPECEEWALSDPDPAVGLVAGGWTPLERQHIRRRRRVA